MVVEFISLTDECRRLARNVVNADFDNNAIISYQKKRFSRISTITDKDDWDSADREFGELQRIETELVASDIIEHYGTTDTIQIWTAMREYAEKDLDKMVANMDTSVPEAETEAEVDRTEFKSWNKNPNVEVPNSLHPTPDTEGF